MGYLSHTLFWTESVFVSQALQELYRVSIIEKVLFIQYALPGILLPDVLQANPE